MKYGVLFASTVMTIAVSAAAQGAGPQCQLVKLADWRVQPIDPGPVVEAAINGQKAGMLLDTGAAISLISPSTVQRLQLTLLQRRDTRMFGIGGESRVAGVSVELKIGDATLKDWQAIVAGEHSFGYGVDMLLGYDFFHQADFEFDLAHNAVRIFEARNCQGASLAYWARDAAEVALEPAAALQVPVKINGKTFIAELDSGAMLSTLSTSAAADVGRTQESPGVVSGGCSMGLGKILIDSWRAPFESFAIGGEVIRNPQIRFADLWKHARTEETGSHIPRRVGSQADMLLGLDFLRAHRVLVSHSQRKMYFSYAGGTVFPATPGRPCSELKSSRARQTR
jgi:hypothetical protein